MPRLTTALLAAAGLATLPFAVGCETTETIADDYKQQAFDQADTDGDGSLTRPEWAQSDYAKQVTGDVDARFDEFDTDGDGGLDIGEVEAGVVEYIN
ncbi:MAG: hypothetical protein AAGK09_09310 [Planctomycetota bacterium]